MPLSVHVPDRRPAYATFGVILLAIACLGILAGRFTLSRISRELPDIDLRWGFVYLLILLTLCWIVVPNPYFECRFRMRGAGWFVAWIAWMALSAMWAPSGARLGQQLEDLALLSFFVLFIWWLLAMLPLDDSVRVFKWLLIVAVLYFMLSMAQGPQAQGRYSAPGGGPNVFARIMILGTLAALYYLMSRRKTLSVSLLMPVFLLGAVMSGSRGALLGAVVAGLLLCFPLVRRLGFWRFFLSLAVILGISTIVLQMSKIDIASFVDDRYVKQTLEQGYSSGRDEITGDVWRLFTENPLIGTGLDGYYALQATPERFEYPHNLLLSTMAEGGVVGAFLLCATWYCLFRAACKERPLALVVLIALTAFFFLTVASFTSGDYYDSRYLWFFGSLGALGAAKTATRGEVSRDIGFRPLEN